MKKRTLLSLFIILSATLVARQNKDLWKLESAGYENYTGIPVANGRIGMLPWREPFSVLHVILNHVFDISPEYGVTRVLQGINPFVVRVLVDGQEITMDNISAWKQTVDMRHAVHISSFEMPGRAEISCEMRALRNMPYSGLMIVRVKALRDITVEAFNEMAVPEGYRDIRHQFRSLRAGNLPVDFIRTDAASENGMQRVSAASMFIDPAGKTEFGTKEATQMSIQRVVKRGESFTFALAGSVCTTRDFTDPAGESERQVIYIAHEGLPAVVSAHERLWDDLWQGDIVIEGDDEAQRLVRSALYNLYSYGLEGSALSISPMGLSSRGYNGHIFWDSELWMFPPMLLFNRGIAESMISYRVNRLEGAIKKAAAYGYKGAMFPWESDDAGEEATPVFAVTGQFENHITADVAIACWNYYCVTRDKKWLRESGFPLIRETAGYWESRVQETSEGKYAIAGVVGADEYAEGITDNAFTNAAVKKNLEYAVKAAGICGEKAPAAWSRISKGLSIHAFEDGVTREYLTYNGQTIKQADVNLLGYPLGVITDEAQLKKDLEYYEGKIDTVHGPAMTYSVFCVQYARLGKAEKATQMFRKCYEPYVRPPFYALAETASSNNPYFATCAGGLLQAVVNGFGGLEITSKGIVQKKSVLPASWKRLIIKGVGPERKTYVVENKQ